MIDRRRFIQLISATAFAGTGALHAFADGHAGAARKAGVGSGLGKALAGAEYVYVSPLQSNGKKSRCHKEVWYAWIDGSVVLTTDSDRWKSTSIDRGLTRARIWVGNVGRGPSLSALEPLPSFTARAEKVKDPALVERMLEVYDEKYPAEIGRWRDRMRKGNADGSRALIRYTPI